MRRTELPEIHDHPVFPGFLRDYVTEVLEALWQRTGAYRSILPVLKQALDSAGTDRVLDLCSGGGGPWSMLAQELEQAYGCTVRVCLTDRYPNQRVFNSAPDASNHAITFEPASIDATRVPRKLSGLRTIFSSFHHFAPEYARAILDDAVDAGQGIAIFEVAQRRAMTVLLTLGLPFFVLALVPGMRPFRWGRLFWTWIIPVIPFVLGFDGLVSCMRTYSRPELEQLAASVSHSGYRWQTGSAGTGRLRVTYLIGCPQENTSSRARDEAAFGGTPVTRLGA
jgi:hypothetical protein